MNKRILILTLLTIFTGIAFFSCKHKAPVSEKSVAKTLLTQIDSFTSLCYYFKIYAESPSASEKELQKFFLQTRLAYKKFEWAAEYFEPATTRMVNGPPVQEVEMEDAGEDESPDSKTGKKPAYRVLEPAGLQVMEGFLFPKYDSARKKELVRQLALLETVSDKYKSRFGNYGMYDLQVFDAVRLEVYRIMTLGITGFDNPLTQESMTESAASLKSLGEVLVPYAEMGNDGALLAALDGAISYLETNPDFNSFNRAEFITKYCNPVTTGIASLEKKLKIHSYKYNRLLNQDAGTLFDSNAFNVNAYAPDHYYFISDEKTALGKVLFYDPVLSGTGNRSCQSCHQPEKAFTDGLIKNTMIGGSRLLKRNTPTLINAAIQPALFYDLRVNSLEDQSLTVIESPEEMHGSMKVTVQKLWKSKMYREMFSEAFPKKNRTGIDTMEVMNALGSYIRSLTMLNSRFDEYMRGNQRAMSGDEIDGFNLFMGKAKCATCHFMPLFNGNLPPEFKKMETEVIGVPLSPGKNETDPDMGRYDIIKVASLKHAFKTPTIRNAARTAPYMHNGVFSTLQQVVDFYNKGGGAGLGLKLENQTLPFDKLNLSEKEQGDIIAFIKCLDSK